MPTNKQASCRYRILNQMFRRPRKWLMSELVEAVGRDLSEYFPRKNPVSERTIRGDINLMRSDPPRGFGAPILCVKGQYFYEDRNFSIENLPFSENDLAVLGEAFLLLRQFKGLPQIEPLLSTLQKFEYWARFPDSQIIQFETNDRTEGTHWIDPLYQAIRQQQALRILYHPFTVDAPYELVLHPCHLREYRNRWFLFGLHDEERTVYNLALDRIKEVSVAKVAYLPAPDFNPATYFQDLIGVTRYRDAHPVDLLFRARPLLSKYLKSKPLHSSQRLVEEMPEWVSFTLHVIPNFELYSELMRFGKNLEVLGPEEVLKGLADVMGA